MISLEKPNIYDQCQTTAGTSKTLTEQIQTTAGTSKTLTKQIQTTAGTSKTLTKQIQTTAGTSKTLTKQIQTTDEPRPMDIFDLMEMSSDSSMETDATDSWIDTQLSCPSSLSIEEPIYNESTEEQVPNPKVHLPFCRPIITHKYCFICSATTNLITIPFDARKQVFIKRKIFVPNGNRCCRHHLIKKRLYEEDVDAIEIYSNNSQIDSDEIVKFFYSLSDNPSNLHGQIGDRSVSERHFWSLTGHTWQQMEIISKKLVSMKNSGVRSITQALVTLLYKMRTGVSNDIIAATVGLESRKQVESHINSVLESFSTDILPTEFGFKSQTRQFLINERTSPVAKKLFDFDDQLMIICDGTYVRHQKSSNNIYQRKSYSMHKNTSLCKPFTVCTTDGFILDVSGPFNAKMNDAQILDFLLQETNGLSTILRPGDIFVLDRGFRDVVPVLKKKGYKVLMPAFKDKGRTQLTCQQSNESRFVTKIRWVVEAIHGIIGQKYDLLHRQYKNYSLKKLGLYCRIACYLYNTFGKRLTSDYNMVDTIVNRMKSKRHDQNYLAELVEENRWNRRLTAYKQLNSEDLLDFPEMTIDELKIFFTGTYQLGQSISYLAEMLNDDDTLTIRYVIERPGIIHLKVPSRHVSAKKYRCYVEYEPNTNGTDGIKGHYCECANGNRTIGCCSHVAAIVYYLSLGRYLSRIFRPAQALTNIFDHHEDVIVIDEDSDDDGMGTEN
ncbi:uncharacterized protein LOC142597771 [Dermatophagoides farinae]|uniref:uncharacterized protein LOC142597771 n=1 Tax=Dermatophagoides farinae TaxID=6954 RepID=UPI003F61AFF7